MRIRKFASISILLTVLLFWSHLLTAQWAKLADDPGAQQRIAWWREARFGMFLHWGVYSIPGRGEWVQWNEQIPVNRYARLADEFHPDRYDPDAWAALA